ncbi:Pex19-domain-containing protein [Aspergillus heteromorphus CBS 117.55]|uniref:Pex19-domain-containing protein n=1 Tax=Aspergillus heteromorphus CBS 117.55 TaxID=1448321 RepID=A0A317X2S1_9EURO|nr:Pex19-domain-containing protein [Aspergillus heteromorphus CBS 117.55]PWY92451.1 Pex19-domain-containing protein [Aspergillus heteromorphus CBS 117.55]
MASPSASPATTPGANPNSQSASSSSQFEKPSATSSDAQPASPNAPSETPAPSRGANVASAEDDDDDSDFDDLDEVLDDFKPTPKPASASATAPDASPAADDFDEEAFLKQLEQDMASMMGGAGGKKDSSASGSADQPPLDADAETFAKYFEESGINASDFLKQLVGDVIMKGDDGASSSGAGAGAGAGAGSSTTAAAASTGSGSGSAAAGGAPETFNDTIQRTINRMKESGDKATAAASEDEISDDLVAQLLKAIEAGGGAGEDGGDEGDLTKMFMGMMEQLSNKEILYEPMKELDEKFGPWLEENRKKGTVSAEDLERFERQAAVVKVIVAKFEETGYSDEDQACREFVWEKMQEMQAAGNPPDELISAPWMEGPGAAGAGAGAGAGPGAGGIPDCPQQ